MEHLLALADARRHTLFDEAGARLELSAGSIEKDLWVWWILRTLFALPASGRHLTFKGGTSLSKGWRLIQRFSEDLDIVLDRDILGFRGAQAPEVAPSPLHSNPPPSLSGHVGRCCGSVGGGNSGGYIYWPGS